MENIEQLTDDQMEGIEGGNIFCAIIGAVAGFFSGLDNGNGGWASGVADVVDSFGSACGCY